MKRRLSLYMFKHVPYYTPHYNVVGCDWFYITKKFSWTV